MYLHLYSGPYLAFHHLPPPLGAHCPVHPTPRTFPMSHDIDQFNYVAYSRHIPFTAVTKVIITQTSRSITANIIIRRIIIKVATHAKHFAFVLFWHLDIYTPLVEFHFQAV